MAVLPGIMDFTKPPDLTIGDFTPGAANEARLSPEIQSLVQEQYAAPRAEATRGLKTAAEAMAARRGLELFDTPVGQPYLREQRKLEEQFGSAEAESMLGLTTDYRNFMQRQAESKEGAFQQRGQMFESTRRFDEQLGFNTELFQAELKQLAFKNRLALATLSKDIGLGLAGVRSGVGSSTVNISGGAADSLNLLGSGMEALSKSLGGFS